MTYEEAQFFSQIISMAIFAGLFAAVLIYTFKSSNKKKFEAASKLPLANDDDNLNGR